MSGFLVPPDSGPPVRTKRMARVSAGLLAVALLAAFTESAGSQPGLEYELREGLWVGEAMATASMDGTAEGASATYDGMITTEFTVFVEESGLLDGDWVMDGFGIMRLSGLSER